MEREKPTFDILGRSRYFSAGVYEKLTGENKELLIIPGANHTDLYDRMDVIPFDKLDAFFRDNLG